MLMCIHVYGARSQHWVPSSVTLPFFSHTGFPITSASLVRQQGQGMLLSQPPQQFGDCVYKWVLDIKPRSLCLHNKDLSTETSSWLATGF